MAAHGAVNRLRLHPSMVTPSGSLAKRLTVDSCSTSLPPEGRQSTERTRVFVSEVYASVIMIITEALPNRTPRNPITVRTDGSGLKLSWQSRRPLSLSEVRRGTVGQFRHCKTKTTHSGGARYKSRTKLDKISEIVENLTIC